jgi:transcriptional regulator with XRE-family HTH domain
MKTAERIRQARRKAGLSQTQLAQRIKVQRSAVSNWESPSDIFPTMLNLVAIARTCEVSIEWLGTGRGSMQLSHDPAIDTPAVDADIVEQADERELLASFREMPHRSRALFLDLARALRVKNARKRNAPDRMPP